MLASHGSGMRRLLSFAPRMRAYVLARLIFETSPTFRTLLGQPAPAHTCATQSSMPYTLLSMLGYTLVSDLPLLLNLCDAVLSIRKLQTPPSAPAAEQRCLRRSASTLGRPRAGPVGAARTRAASDGRLREPPAVASVRLGPRDEGATAPVVEEARG
jgi:hypothetical protein